MYYAFVENEKINGVGESPVHNKEIQNIEISEDVFNAIIEENDKYIWNGVEIIINPDYEEERAKAREEVFHKEFFNTSLGYVRRKVTMADGSTKDFLSDLLPTISMALNLGTSVGVITYYEPDFVQDVVDWTIYQRQETVTVQFVQECFLQLQKDFSVSG